LLAALFSTILFASPCWVWHLTGEWFSHKFSVSIPISSVMICC
jgi:hypothetical protein